MRKGKTLMIVLGSGGHTGELLIMLKKLDFSKFSEIYVISSMNDKHSENKFREAFNVTKIEKCNFFKIYRSRNVGQSFKSSIFTTIFSMLHSIFILLKP